MPLEPPPGGFDEEGEEDSVIICVLLLAICKLACLFVSLGANLLSILLYALSICGSLALDGSKLVVSEGGLSSGQQNCGHDGDSDELEVSGQPCGMPRTSGFSTGIEAGRCLVFGGVENEPE